MSSPIAGLRRVLAAIHPPATTTAILECLDLPPRAPPVAGLGVEAVEFATDPPPDWEPDPIFDSEF